MQSNKNIIIALVVIAVVLGFVIFKQKSGINSESPTAANTQTFSFFDENLTADEKKLFYVPMPDASKEEVMAHFELALKMAQTNGQIIITDCAAVPSVLKVKLGETFNVKNAGNKEIEFGFDSMVKILPGKTVKITANFKNGVGLYGYGCENPDVQRSIGFVLVSP